MRPLFLSLIIVLLSGGSLAAQVMIYEPGSRGANLRIIEKGKGQEFTEDFVDFQSYHFVQFGVYPASVDRYDIKAPKAAGQSWLIFHEETLIRGSEEPGAYYIVKPFSTEAEARANAETLKKQGLNCWYNNNLTDVAFVLVAISFPQ
jgi:hypothetical protein